jgi:hypothetical protein
MVLAALILIPLGALHLSPNYNYCVAHNGEHATGQTDQDGTPIIEPAIDQPTAVNLLLFCGGLYASENADTMTALSTVLLTILTFGLAYLAYDQGRTTRAQLRAYVFLDKLSFEREGQALTLTFTMLNSGETPAKNVLWRSAIRFGKEEPDFAEPSPNTPKPFVLPRGVPRDMVATTNDIPKPTLDAYLRGDFKLWVWGFITYDDQFGRGHTTWFRYFSDGGADYEKTGFLHCPGGNDAD